MDLTRGRERRSIRWPEGKDFAFTVFDDTDYARMDNVPPVYEFLRDHGFRTTKSVWPLRAEGTPAVEGATCEDRDYLDWLYGLQESGFEIGCHGVAGRSSVREEIIRGLDRFKELFGHDPVALSNHTDCREGMYWGRDRLTGVHRRAYELITRFRHYEAGGHVKGDPHFWGDVCREKVKYLRNFVFADINTLRACPIMPYHDPRRPYVNYWFASSEGAVADSFNRCIEEAAQDRLEEEGGACIMYTHFAFGFYVKNGLNSTFRSLMQRLSKKNGWFVPVSTLLDYLLEASGHHDIADRERRRLERRWLSHKLRIGPS
jgi:hypothetical protein